MDLGSLCIEAGRAVWVLYIDILILSNGGNLLDACVTALNGALEEGMLPSDIVCLE
jgi:exosome complex component RRP43